ncbi:MAG: AMP-binding protein [Desulfobacteraceae bacterium]|nr:AMP-binding protein [Desulfobacteraceae bacterium]MBU4001648.1 AMP-binding protein [Pseudomonadota bacterium]MBU4055784.1 AMP-binding protein [Pseudomonadota bacterium]
MLYHHSTYAKTKPDGLAYIMARDGEKITWRDYDRRINQLARYFREIGLMPGDHIALCMENNAKYFEIMSASGDCGLIFTCVSTHLKISEMEYIINNCEAKCFITSDQKREDAKVLLDRMPRVTHRLMVGGKITGYDSYEEILAGYSVDPIPLGMAGQAMLYSSGTTGLPKGVLSTVQATPVGELGPTAQIMAQLYQMNENSIYLSPAPLYHAAPLAFCAMTLSMGGTVIVMERFDAEASLALIEKYKATHSQWVPTMFIRMLKLPEPVRKQYDISSMKMAIHAAAPCPIEIKEQMIQWWGPVFLEYYAGTEGNTMVMISSAEWLQHKGSVGKAYIGKIHILDDEEKELPSGQPGLIFVEEGNTFEYHKEPKKTAESRSSHGWSTLGDIGYLDQEEYLYLTDRKSNMIISGGVNIYPQEAENVLTLHHKIMDVAVIGVPNEDFGEEVKAVVQLMDPDEAGPELERELIAYCKERLSDIKCPRSIDFTNDLPRTPTGKLIKRLLKEKYWGKDGKTI